MKLESSDSMSLKENIESFIPYNIQEENDKKLILEYIDMFPDILTRDNKLCHFTASNWIVNKDRTKVFMAYHNIYDSWSWLGGHADGEEDLRKVALREVQEESGIRKANPVTDDLFSIEVLTVDGHWKRGSYVSSHLHLNVTYLVEASEDEMLSMKPDENSGVAWFGLEEAVEASTEPWFKEHIYRKLNEKLKTGGENRRLL